MMRDLAVIVAGLVWVFWWWRARPLARTLDRWEVMILKPLAITSLIGALFYVTRGAWLMAVLLSTLWFLYGTLGAALHRDRTATELAKGTMRHMETGPRQPLTHDESVRLSKVHLGATLLTGIAFTAMAHHHAISTLLAVVIGMVGGFIFLGVSSVAVAYQGRRPRKASVAAAPAGAAAGHTTTESADVSALRRRLLSITLGDARRVEWLLALERQAQPDADLATLLRGAIDRWERDNRSWR